MAGESDRQRSEIIELTAAGDGRAAAAEGSSLREFITSYIGWSALIGIVIAVVGIVLSLVSPARWASGLLFVGLAIFCVAGLAARHDNSRRLDAARTPPQRGLSDLEL